MQIEIMKMIQINVVKESQEYQDAIRHLRPMLELLHRLEVLPIYLDLQQDAEMFAVNYYHKVKSQNGNEV